MKYFFTFLFASSLLLFFSSCTSSSKTSSWDYASNQGGFEQADNVDGYFQGTTENRLFNPMPLNELSNLQQVGVSAEVSNADSKPQSKERKLTYSANLDLIVKDNSGIVDALDSIARAFKGYIQNGSNDYITLKVESDQLEAALESIKTLGKVERLRISTADVSEYYLDSEIRLDNARKARARYLELLDQAENVEAALLVERELERVNGIIDLYAGKLNKLNDQIRYANIQITIKEKVKLGPLGFISKGIYKGLRWLFVRN